MKTFLFALSFLALFAFNAPANAGMGLDGKPFSAPAKAPAACGNEKCPVHGDVKTDTNPQESELPEDVYWWPGLTIKYI